MSFRPKKRTARGETFGERLQRYRKEFEKRFTELAGRPPTFKEREEGYGMYYTDKYGPWEAASIVAEDLPKS